MRGKKNRGRRGGGRPFLPDGWTFSKIEGLRKGGMFCSGIRRPKEEKQRTRANRDSRQETKERGIDSRGYPKSTGGA